MTAAPKSAVDLALAEFTARFAGAPEVIASAPGRVELLGNHTDYNGGLVMAAAIDRATVFVGRSTLGREARVASIQLRALDSFSIDDIGRTESGAWTRYVRGVCWALSEWRGPLKTGFDAVVVGDVPLGAGLSSSASLQAAFAMFLIEIGAVAGVSSLELSNQAGDALRFELAQVLRRSENEFVGVGSGLLDQFSSLFGREGCALVLDCSTLEFDRLPLGDPGPAIVVCDSKTSRRLADGMYDRRRAECEAVASAFSDVLPRGGGTGQLSRLSLAQLESRWEALDPVGRKRARHVLSENERVRQGAAALKSGDAHAFGRLMSASHASSRDDFGNSSEALDALIEIAAAAPGFLGGKLSGAGWAGCTVNLVEAECADEFARTVAGGYCERAGITPEIHVCRAASGACARRVLPAGS